MKLAESQWQITLQSHVSSKTHEHSVKTPSKSIKNSVKVHNITTIMNANSLQSSYFYHLTSADTFLVLIVLTETHKSEYDDVEKLLVKSQGLQPCDCEYDIAWTQHKLVVLVPGVTVKDDCCLFDSFCNAGMCWWCVMSIRAECGEIWRFMFMHICWQAKCSDWKCFGPETSTEVICTCCNI